jgi:hypothetical protein
MVSGRFWMQKVDISLDVSIETAIAAVEHTFT